MKFRLERNQSNKISRDEMISELEKVAKHFNYTDFRQDDFNKLSCMNYYTIYREFGSWDKVMQFLKTHFNEQGIAFEILTRRSVFSINEMFDEMERIWTMLDHRPSRDEWTASNPKISYDTIYRQFGGWTKACTKFIEYKSGEIIPVQEPERRNGVLPKTKSIKQSSQTKISASRSINLSLRLKVLNRDKFKCVFCGKSPATDIGTKLHIDHKVAFANGGTNDIENLQTLCEECNLGKSNMVLD